ncbi:protein SanA, affects membrane permeability for vancomycin [Paenibacillus sp. UNCCL117]|uniref:SanA/YdcF family protein n=1 Tax=unclassified Paenibacillus TaxID=185978 RepID=UPI0008921B0E|nr:MULTISPECIES: ElyC/SanA/YdcF family protein [unclassified Paenibacillus]SDD40252.1 protein SanA, affects membrane permeability for vancomycin [Paenibacillus sp. cl123]SFW48150.1 protein SanA, affects membrane permeability for vancomycin [Paenibacillus sp. UNCCL117]
MKQRKRKTEKSVKRAVGRLLRLLALAGLMGCTTFLVVNEYVLQSGDAYILPKDELPQVEAAIVLGASVYSNGKVSDILRDRLDTAYDLYVSGLASRIIVSGDHASDDYDEVNAMKNYLMKKGVRDAHIFMDHAGFNTYDSMYRAQAVFQAQNLIIVTQDYHLKRAIYVARALGIEAVGAASDKQAYRDIRKYEAREVLARVKDFLNVHFMKPPPAQLGEPIPLSSDGRLTNDK